MQKTSNKGMIFKTYKEFLKRNNKKTAQLKKWSKSLNRDLTKENIQMANKHVKGCSTLHVIREMAIKTMRYHY